MSAKSLLSQLALAEKLLRLLECLTTRSSAPSTMPGSGSLLLTDAGSSVPSQVQAPLHQVQAAVVLDHA